MGFLFLHFLFITYNEGDYFNVSVQNFISSLLSEAQVFLFVLLCFPGFLFYPLSLFIGRFHLQAHLLSSTHVPHASNLVPRARHKATPEIDRWGFIFI